MGWRRRTQGKPEARRHVRSASGSAGCSRATVMARQSPPVYQPRRRIPAPTRASGTWGAANRLRGRRVLGLSARGAVLSAPRLFEGEGTAASCEPRPNGRLSDQVGKRSCLPAPPRHRLGQPLRHGPVRARLAARRSSRSRPTWLPSTGRSAGVPIWRACSGARWSAATSRRAADGPLADRLGLGDTVRNFLGVLAPERRLAALPAMIDEFARLLAAHRGEETARGGLGGAARRGAAGRGPRRGRRLRGQARCSSPLRSIPACWAGSSSASARG